MSRRPFRWVQILLPAGIGDSLEDMGCNHPLDTLIESNRCGFEINRIGRQTFLPVLRVVGTIDHNSYVVEQAQTGIGPTIVHKIQIVHLTPDPARSSIRCSFQPPQDVD